MGLVCSLGEKEKASSLVVVDVLSIPLLLLTFKSPLTCLLLTFHFLLYMNLFSEAKTNLSGWKDVFVKSVLCSACYDEVVHIKNYSKASLRGYPGDLSLIDILPVSCCTFLRKQ